MANRYAIPVTIGNINGNLIPSGDDTYDIGSATAAWQDLFLEGDIYLSDATTIATTAGDLTIDSAGGKVIIDPTVSTTGAMTQLQVKGDITVTGGTQVQSFVAIGGHEGGSVIVNSGGATPIISTLSLSEPNITETSGSVTIAATLYIKDAPSEADHPGYLFNNYAIHVDNGVSHFESHTAGDQTLDIHNTGTSADNYLIIFADDGAHVGSVKHDNAGNTTSSDYRLKENAVTLSGAVTRVKTLKPYRFNFKRAPGRTQDGFFAHEVAAVVPEAVAGTKDAVHADNSIFPQDMDSSKLVPLLTAAIQELDARITTLES